MKKLSYKNNLGEAYLEHGADAIWSKCEAYDILKSAINKLAEYEDTGLTPQEIEQMKARMPLHQWAGESTDKMSIFGVSVSRIIELTKAEKQGRLIVLNIQDIHPCRNCDTGWGSASSEGCHSCEETCVRLKEYNNKYNT
jgi:hypothetical protein